MRKYVPYLFMGGIALTAVPSLGNLGGVGSQITELREQATAQSQELSLLNLSQEQSDNLAAIAEKRLKDGCVPVFSRDQGNYVTLIVNKPVVDPTTRQALPAGTLLCDAYGNTALLVDDDGDPNTPAVAQQFAFTGNRDLVKDVLSNYRGARFFMPGTED